MPELPEVEGYRALAAAVTLGRTIAAVDAPDAWYLKRGLVAPEIEEVLVGRCFTAARRRGKLMLLDVSESDPPDPRIGPGAVGGVTGSGAVVGLRFGMSGRLICDGRTSVDRLLYGAARDQPGYERFAVEFADGGRMAMSDPRRLGGVELDPDEDRLGPDALTLGPAQLRDALAGAQVALKARLLDQSKVAGIGNLIADEVLWRAALAPGRRPADRPPR